jgi:hypothetical protein
MTKIAMLPGVATTPPVFLAHLQENADKIRHIACVVQWKQRDDRTEAFWTPMSISDLVWLRHVFNRDMPE